MAKNTEPKNEHGMKSVTVGTRKPVTSKDAMKGHEGMIKKTGKATNKMYPC